MRYSLDKMRMKIEDIIFWIAIIAVIGIIIWKLFGSPTDIATLISVGSLLVISELTLWRKLYSNETKVAVGFMKVRGDIKLLKNDISHRFNGVDHRFKEINKRLDDIEALIKRK